MEVDYSAIMLSVFASFKDTFMAMLPDIIKFALPIAIVNFVVDYGLDFFIGLIAPGERSLTPAELDDLDAQFHAETDEIYDDYLYEQSIIENPGEENPDHDYYMQWAHDDGDDDD